MRDNENRNTVFFYELINTILTLLLEHKVADGKHLIDNENLRHNNRRNSKRDASDHARRIILHRHVEEFLYLGKFNYFIKVVLDEFF